ncbi:MAG TPA: zinc ribbon domain-containing protein [Blastocatellia bacterium]|nr:zinc ribbon domain-containing protein [Blastocatellia bacterium]
MPNFTILEPMSTGDVIDRSVRLYRRNFTPLVAIVSVPTLIGYVASLMFWYGYTNLFLTTTTVSAASGDAVWMLILGAGGYIFWLFSLLLTISGLSRVVGDHLMMGEPITFRKCFSSVRRKLGDITVMGLLGLVILFGIYIALVMVVVVIVLIFGIVGGLVISAHLPQWAITLVMAIMGLIAIATALIVVSFIFARVVFLPQVVMIEGESAGTAVGRASRLGKGNWHRVGSIALFTYFVSMSLMWALTLPVLAVLYLSGMVGDDFFSSSTWNVFYISFKDLSSMLSLPIWIVSFTLLYFDSRVRKEAYDIELLAREVAPGFYWQPSPVAAQPFGGFAHGRAYVQTSPLGLGGMTFPAPVSTTAAQTINPTTVSNAEGRDALNISSQSFQPPVRAISTEPQADGSGLICKRCGDRLEHDARFCNRCGNPVEPVQFDDPSIKVE